jgi:hypothetical protein
VETPRHPGPRERKERGGAMEDPPSEAPQAARTQGKAGETRGPRDPWAPRAARTQGLEGRRSGPWRPSWALQAAKIQREAERQGVMKTLGTRAARTQREMGREGE